MTEGESAGRHYGTNTAALLVAAGMIGTGVFTTTGFFLRGTPSPLAVLVGWILGGVAACCGAWGYAELGMRLPRNGGEYAILGRVVGPATGFAFGVASVVVGFAAPAAASALAFGEFVDAAGLSAGLPPRAWGALLVVAAGLAHAAHWRTGSRFQDISTFLKVALLGVFGAVAALAPAAQPARLLPVPGEPTWDHVLSGSFAASLVYVSYAYSGWNGATYIAGEVKDPVRALPRALVLGTAAVMMLYAVVNAAMMMAAPMEALAGAGERAVHVAAEHLWGTQASRVVAAVVALGLISNVGAFTWCGARIMDAMGTDHAALAALSQRTTGQSPARAVMVQVGLGLFFLLTSTFGTLLAYVGLTLSLATALAVGGLFVLRRRQPDGPRLPGQPLAGAVFLALTAWMIVFAVRERPVVALASAATLGGGALLHAWVERVGARR